MSHLITRTYLPLEMDILTPRDLVSGFWVYRVPSAFNTTATVNADTITLSAGYSYYIEAAIQAYANATPCSLSWQVYDKTNSTVIGQDAYMSIRPSYGAATRQGRKCARALILDSDINNEIEIQVKLTATSQSISSYDWADASTSGSSFRAYTGTPSVRIWQLPS